MSIPDSLKSAFQNLFASNPHLTLTSTPNFGSLQDGNLLQYLPCASAINVSEACKNRGTLACSKCRLVKYCSKECQTVHWKSHKAVCNSPHASASWKPGWMKENRSPAFSASAQTPLFGGSFGRIGQYMWGNTPASDILNLPSNEGEARKKEDYTICFAASGDLRNMIATVNHLPDNYQGQCNIILNDMNPYVTIRNLLLLAILFTPDRPAEEVAELALHVSYSAMLTADQTLALYQRATQFFEKEDSMVISKFRSQRSHVHFVLPKSTPTLASKMLTSRYTTDLARKSMHDAVFAPSRVDYRDRHWACLRPGPRLADMRYKREGVMLPFGAPREHFSQPNRLIFDENGEWLTGEHASPLGGWDIREVIKTGARKSVTSEDLFGCLFFHVKEQFAEFSRRVQNLRINIFQFGVSAAELCTFIVDNPGNYFPTSALDRIDTSNVMDYLGPSPIISEWAPLLNPKNPNSTLLAYTMNWYGQEPDAHPESAGYQAFGQTCKKAIQYFGISNPLVLLVPTRSVEGLRLRMNLQAFHEAGPPFESYLKRMRVPEVARKCKVRRRTRNSICPQLLGSTLSNPKQRPENLSKDELYYLGINDSWSTRYLEFERDV